MATGKRRSRSNGSLEHEVIACLAATGVPMTPAEVSDALGHDLSYSTVTTTLARLHGKQALLRTRRGRAFAYRLPGDATIAEASVTAHQMQRLLDTGADPATVLSRFVDALDDETEAMLRALLTDADVAPPDAADAPPTPSDEPPTPGDDTCRG